MLLTSSRVLKTLKYVFCFNYNKLVIPMLMPSRVFVGNFAFCKIQVRINVKQDVKFRLELRSYVYVKFRSMCVE